MKLKKLLIPAAIIVLAASAFMSYSAYKRYLKYLPLEYIHNNCKATDSALNNPYCGFYQIYPYKLSDNSLTGNILPGNIDETKDRLAMVQVNLCLYKEQPLSSGALSQLDSILAAWAGTDKQLILRFLYDWNGTASLTEPSDINIILKHMEQTAEVYNKYAESIYILQGLYTGSYGEMHSSFHQDKKSVTRLARKLYKVSDPLIFLAVRTPAQFRAVTEGTGGLVNDRYGLFNDGMLSSASDSGTYAEGEREEEISFQESLCLTVPNGGEVITDNPLNSLGNAVKDLNKMHVSYLNSMYDSAVLDKWKASEYTGEDIFNGCNGYEYIEKHLGFRYITSSSTLEFEPYTSKTAKLFISLENTGFAPNYYPFNYTVTCINQETGKSYTVTSVNEKTDNNKTKITLSATLDVRDMEPGTYKIYLDTADSKTGETIKYAIDTPLEEEGYFTGTLKYLEKNF